jgi:hypothetical protein
MGEPNVHFNPKHKHALLNAMRHVDERIPENTPVVLDSGLGHAGRFRAAADKHDARKILRGMLRDHHGCDVEESINEALGTCKHCGSFFQRSVLKDHVGTCSERGSAPEPAPRRARTPREHPLIKKAKKHFGVTHDPREAGYITPDGQMLDLSGKNDGGDPGHRARDHREISHITPDKLPDDLESDSPTHHMWHFMRETGAVRMNYATDPRNRSAPASVNVDFMRKPTMAQRQTLARIGRYSELVYDVFHPKTLERLHSDDTGRASIGSMLGMVDHHLKEDTPRADQLISKALAEGRVIQFDQLFPMTSMATRASRLGYSEVDRIDDGRRRGVVMKHNDGHKMVIVGDRYLKNATAYLHTGDGNVQRLGRDELTPYLARLHRRK